MLYSHDMLLREPSAHSTCDTDTTVEVEGRSNGAETGTSSSTNTTTGSDVYEEDKAVASTSDTSGPATSPVVVPETENKVDAVEQTRTDTASNVTTNKTINTTRGTYADTTVNDRQTNTNNDTSKSDISLSTTRRKATPLSPDTATAAATATATFTTSGSGGDSPSGFGFIPGTYSFYLSLWLEEVVDKVIDCSIYSIKLKYFFHLYSTYDIPALLKRTVVDPGLQSARQAVTGDIRGAATTALGAAASVTKEGAGDILFYTY